MKYQTLIDEAAAAQRRTSCRLYTYDEAADGNWV